MDAQPRGRSAGPTRALPHPLRDHPRLSPGDPTTKLVELASTIRSKNAGVDHITFDVICRDRRTFERVRDSGALNRSAVARLFGIDESRVTDFVVFEPANAIKFTIRRLRPSGGMGESDLFGSQQYAPLFDVEIP